MDPGASPGSQTLTHCSASLGRSGTDRSALFILQRFPSVDMLLSDDYLESRQNIFLFKERTKMEFLLMVKENCTLPKSRTGILQF